MLNLRSRRAVTMIEVLIAFLVIAGLGVTVQGLMVSTIQGIQIDRASEVKRNMTLDLLEKFCHPYTSLTSLFGEKPTFPATREIPVDKAIEAVGLPVEEGKVVKAILETAGVYSFSLTWQKGLEVGPGSPASALRLDQLFVRPVETKTGPGARLNSFRVFYVRSNL
jgi:hypothetical protein